MASKIVLSNRQPLTFNGLARFQGHFCNREVVVRLLHFWHARNSRSNTLMGIELLLLDSESNALQGFISASRLNSFEPYLAANSLYKLKKFFVQTSKKFYTVADHEYNILFTSYTSFVPVPDGTSQIDKQKFRIRSFPEFLAIVDTNTELFDVIGQIRLVAGDNLQSCTTEAPPLQLAVNRSEDRVFLNLLMKGGETILVCLWGDIASTFRARWNKNAPQPIVLLITTMNPKTIGGVLSLRSTSSTRLFFDHDIAETQAFMTWLGNGCFKVPVLTTSSSTIARFETVSITEIQEFLKNEYPQSANVFVHATIVDILGDHGWNYISCDRCSTRLGKTGTSMYCATCEKTNKLGVLRYRLEILVSDRNNSVATFVLFDRDATNILGIKAEDLPSDSTSVDATPSVPSFIRNIIGMSFTFQLKVTSYNFTAGREFFTVSRIVDHNILGGFAMKPYNITGDASVEKALQESKYETAEQLLEPTNNYAEEESFERKGVYAEQKSKRIRLE